MGGQGLNPQGLGGSENLGASETDAQEANTVTLPAGASIDEDSGDLVVKDANGNIVVRYDEASSEWQFQSQTLTGIGSLATEGLHTKSRYADAVVWEDADGDWHADGANGEIASGSSADTVLQSAVDDAGTKTVLAINLDPSSVSITVTGNEVVQYLYSDTAAGGLGNVWQEGTAGAAINFWGSGEDGDYQSINWFPEQRGTTDTDTDVRITAHSKKDDGTVHKHLSIYTAKADGTPRKRLDLGYGSDYETAEWENLSLWEIDTDIFRLKTSDDGTQIIQIDTVDEEIVDWPNFSTGFRIPFDDGIAMANGAEIVADNNDDDGVLNLIQSFADDKIRVGGVSNAGVQIYSGGTINLNADVNINPSNTYTLTNVTTDRVLDANSTTTEELADVLSTLIQDLGMDA